MKYDYLVVGAGLYGAVFAHEAKKTGKSVLVIDKRPYIAGNVYTGPVEGIQVHKYSNIRHTTADAGYKYAAEETTNWEGNTIYPKANYLNNYTFTEHNYFALFDIAVGGSFVGGENDKTKVPVNEDFEAQFDIDWIKISKIK